MRTEATARVRPIALALAALVLLGGCEDLRAARLFQIATEYGARGQWSQALHYFERLWVQFPSSDLVPEARLKAARIYAGPQNKPRSAEDAYRTLILGDFPEEVRVQALLELADLQVEKLNDTDKAIEVLETYLQRFPQHDAQPRAALRLGGLYIESGRYFQALQEARPLSTTRDPAQRAQAMLLVGQAQEYMKAPAAALESYEQAAALAITGTATGLAAQEGRIRCLDEIGRWQEAVTALVELKARHPNPEAVARWLQAVEDRHAEMGR